MSSRVPVYFDQLIAGFERGTIGRCAHLGHWDSSPEHAQGSAPATRQNRAETFSAAQQRMDEVMISMAQLTSHQSVLDVGCGFGGLLQQIDSRCVNMSLIGLNIDPRQLDVCLRLRSRSQNTLRWQEADACDLPFPDESFDRVFCVEAMFHFESRRKFLREACRVLKPGGRFVGSDIVLTQSPSTASTPRFLIDAVLNDGYGPWPDLWAMDGTSSSLAQEAGFQSIILHDATQQTLPTYDYIVSEALSEQTDPRDQIARSILLLRWLHQNGGLRYEYLTATKAEHRDGNHREDNHDETEHGEGTHI